MGRRRTIPDSSEDDDGDGMVSNEFCGHRVLILNVLMASRLAAHAAGTAALAAVTLRRFLPL